MDSIWRKTENLPPFETLSNDLSVDVLIIGGGITGLLCAYQLEKAGVRYVLVEAERICSGITKNTTAKITAQHGLIYHKLIARYGTELAQMYLTANQMALREYQNLCNTIDCDFQMKNNFVYSIDQKELLEREMSALMKLGYTADFYQSLPLPFPVAGAVCFQNQAQFHPLKFLSRIAQGLKIYENTAVKQLTEHTAITDKGRIAAKNIIVTTHFPFLNKHGSYFLKMYQNRSYVLACKNAPLLNGMYLDAEEKGMSFRNYRDLLFIGGGSHRTGKQGGNWDELEQFSAKYFPASREIGRWATQDCMTLDGIPYIGNYSKHTPHFYVATGFNKWGMTSAMVAAKILADRIVGKRNPYAPVFSPSRSMFHPQLIVNAFEAAKNLLAISPRRCPHMGCALKWNAREHSWDCPCHGSRFTKEGKLLDNPSTGDLRLKPEKKS